MGRDNELGCDAEEKKGSAMEVVQDTLSAHLTYSFSSGKREQNGMLKHYEPQERRDARLNEAERTIR